MSKIRTDLIITQQIQRGKTVFIIKDPMDGQYYKFGELEFSIIKLIDGKNTDTQILEKINKIESNTGIEASDIKDFINSLNKMNLLEKSIEERNAMFVARLRDERKSKLLSKKG